MSSYPPALGALLGELGEVDGGVRVLLLVLLAAGLDEVGVGGHPPPGLGWIFPHGQTQDSIYKAHCGGVKVSEAVSPTRIITASLTK